MDAFIFFFLEILFIRNTIEFVYLGDLLSSTQNCFGLRHCRNLNQWVNQSVRHSCQLYATNVISWYVAVQTLKFIFRIPSHFAMRGCSTEYCFNHSFVGLKKLLVSGKTFPVSRMLMLVEWLLCRVSLWRVTGTL